MKPTKGVVFLGGPYRSDKGSDGTYENLYVQRMMAKTLWAHDYAVVSPNLTSAWMDGYASFDSFEEGSIEIMLRCDVAVFEDGWRKSKGCEKEIHACLYSKWAMPFIVIERENSNDLQQQMIEFVESDLAEEFLINKERIAARREGEAGMMAYAKKLVNDTLKVVDKRP